MTILTKRLAGAAVAAAMIAAPTLAAAAPAPTAAKSAPAASSSPAASLSVARAARAAAPAARKSRLGGAPIGIVATVGIVAGAAGLIYLATKSGGDPFELGDSN